MPTFSGPADFAGVRRRPGLGRSATARRRSAFRSIPPSLPQSGSPSRTSAATLVTATTNAAKGVINTRQNQLHHRRQRPDHRRRQIQRRRIWPTATARRSGCATSARRSPTGRPHRRGYQNNQDGVILAVFKQPGANVIDTVDQIKAQLPQLTARIPPAVKVETILDRTRNDPRLGGRRRVHLGAHHLPRGDGDPAVPAQFLGDAHPERDGAAGARRLVRGDVPDAFQPRQPVADGAHHRGRLRGRRRHRGGGEHLPPRRARRAAVHRGAQGLARDRLHGAVDLLLADRGVHSAAC